MSATEQYTFELSLNYFFKGIQKEQEMSSSTSSTKGKVAQDLLGKCAKQAGLDQAGEELDELISGYVGRLFASWHAEGYGLEELEACLQPILASCGLDSAVQARFIDGLDAAFGGVKDRNGLGPQITAVVPIEAPVQMSLSPISTQMADEPKRVSLDWLSSRRVVASQVDRSKLEKAEAKLRAKAAVRKGVAYYEDGPAGSLNHTGPVGKQQSAEEIVDGILAEWRDTSSGRASGKRDVHCEAFDISLVGRRILTCASIMLANGRRYGLVGRNGIGKSTLLRHIASRQLDGLPAGLTILHVEQEVRGDDTPALKAVLAADVKRTALLAEETRLQSAPESSANVERLQLVYRLLADMDQGEAEARACTILSGLGFAPGDMQRATREFSGGWRMRLALAQALFCQPDLLLLDEPTNMLDFPAVVWLESHLQAWPGTLLVVSHDRLFLDAAVTDILHMHDEQLEAYRGDYAQFLTTRADRQKSQQREYDAQLMYRASLQAFVDRWRYNANRAPQAQSRLKILEKLPELRPVVAEAPVIFRLPPVERLPAPLIQSQNASFSYDGTMPYLIRRAQDRRTPATSAVLPPLTQTIPEKRKAIPVGPVVKRDFFGRIIAVIEDDPLTAGSDTSAPTSQMPAMTYRFNEGFSNAVRRTLRIKDLFPETTS